MAEGTSTNDNKDFKEQVENDQKLGYQKGITFKRYSTKIMSFNMPNSLRSHHKHHIQRIYDANTSRKTPNVFSTTSSKNAPLTACLGQPIVLPSMLTLTL